MKGNAVRPSEPILIAGAGIGGLTAALALRQRDFPVEVYERRADREIQLAGTGLTIWSNATTALGWLGLAAELRARGAELVRVRNVSDDGRVIFKTPVQKYTWPGSLPGYSISRGDLVAMLLEACEDAGVAVHFGHAVAGYAADSAGVTVRLDDGTTVRGAILVGADGVRSAVRTRLFGGLKRIYTGQSAYRGISDDDGGIEPGTAYLFESRSGVTGGAWRVSGGRMAWTFGRRSPAGEPDPADGRKERALDMLAAFRGPAPAIVAGTPADRIVRTDIYYHEWDERWGDGPVTLLGDAAHAVPTVLGQGGCQAIEDGVVLADALATAGDLVQGLRDYEARRVGRVMFIRARILRLMTLPKISNPVVLWAGRKLLRVVITATQGKLWRTLQQPPQLKALPGQRPVTTAGPVPR